MTTNNIFSTLSSRLGVSDRRHHPTVPTNASSSQPHDNRSVSDDDDVQRIASTIQYEFDEEDPWVSITDGTTESPPVPENSKNMWEDNNPLSYDRRSSNSSFLPQYDPEHVISSPTVNPLDYDHDNDPPGFLTQPYHAPSEESKGEDEEEEDEDEEEYRRQRRAQGYNSKVEQYLMENKKPIEITDAGKNHEGSGGFIVYTIKTGDLEVRRRYSEFESLRKNLSLLHPCLIVPPIPEKHQVSDYVTAPTSAKENVNIIEHRKRMLGVFLNRCRRMKEIRGDSVFRRFLDPNASWSEVLTSPPISTLPKHHLKAPPLNPANPSPAHAHLPVPSTSAKLKQAPSPPPPSQDGSYNRFPPLDHSLSESELDPYFTTYEATTRTYEALLTGSIERVNRRILKRLSELSLDYHELGARYNAFSLSEPANLAAAIEKIGQAADRSYIATEFLADELGSGFAEPLRESAQFANVVQKVLRYRVLKRVQEEMTKDLLQQKRALLENLERSENEARRIDQFIHSATLTPPPPAASGSTVDDVESIDSMDGFGSGFPPTHSSSPPRPNNNSKSNQGQRSVSGSSSQTSPSASAHKKSVSFSSPSTASSALSSTASALTSPSGFLAKGFGRLNYAIHGIVDVDPERTRRDNIGKTKEVLAQLEKAIVVAEEDVKSVSAGVLKDLRRFQGEKVADLRAMMVIYAKKHVDWAKKNLEAWEEAKLEVEKIQPRPT
ncbi:Sorting nexin, cytoplasm-to-vacuole targeting pathway/endosomal sorting [Rhizina undulata]